MIEPLYKRYQHRRPCGAVALSNCFGLLVYEPTEEDKHEADYITAWTNNDNSIYGFHRNKLHETSSGRFYLRKGSLRFYTDDIMRV